MDNALPRLHVKFRDQKFLPTEQRENPRIVEHYRETLEFTCMCGARWTWGAYPYGRKLTSCIPRAITNNEGGKPALLVASCACGCIHWKRFNRAHAKVARFAETSG